MITLVPSSSRVDPAEAALDRLAPLPVAVLALVGVPARLPAAGLLPVLSELLGARPEPAGQAGGVGGAEGGGLGGDGGGGGGGGGVGLRLDGGGGCGDPAR